MDECESGRRTTRRRHGRIMAGRPADEHICWQLSVVTLAGLAANAAFGWWWADPVAAIALAGLIAWEGRMAWQRKSCCYT